MQTLSILASIVSILAGVISFWIWLIVWRRDARAARMIDVYVLADGKSAQRVAAVPARAVSRGEILGVLGMLPLKTGGRLHLELSPGEIQSLQDEVGRVIGDRSDTITVRVSLTCYESIRFDN